jgi:hypothetical protein
LRRHVSKEFRGEQMVDVLNHLGVDLVSLGNHEFESDTGQADFEARVVESKFTWLNSNFVFHDDDLDDRLFGSGKMVPGHLARVSATHMILLFGVVGADCPDHIGERIDLDEAKIVVERPGALRDWASLPGRSSPSLANKGLAPQGNALHGARIDNY